jgi:hypothetical protein
VPAKPVWYSRINEILAELRSLPRPFVDRATVERLLGVGHRRAQQILAPCITEHIGANGLADRDQLIARLERLAQGDDGYYENARRRKFGQLLQRLKQERLASPQVLVEAPARILNQEFADLPAGIHLEPGAIRIEFDEPQQALEKLLALAMAIGNDLDRFECLTRRATP